MCVNKLNATALSPIVKIEVPHLRVNKVLFLTVTTHLTNVEYYIRPSKYQLRLTVCDCVYRTTFFCATLLDYGLDLSVARVRVGLTSEFLLWQWSN